MLTLNVFKLLVFLALRRSDVRCGSLYMTEYPYTRDRFSNYLMICIFQCIILHILNRKENQIVLEAKACHEMLCL